MVALTVAQTFDYSSSVLSAVDSIEFTADGAIATFDASQFDGTTILDDVTIVGFGGQLMTNGIVVNGGGVDASHWSFSGWFTGFDSITFNGSTGDDVFDGSSARERIYGKGGSDVIRSTDGNGDLFYGGGGRDAIRYRSVADITDLIDGGGSIDRIQAAGLGTFNFTGATIVSVEEVRFGADTQTMVFSANQLVAAGGSLTKVIGSAESDTLRIEYAAGDSIDFGPMRMRSWTGDDWIAFAGSGDLTLDVSSVAESVWVEAGAGVIDVTMANGVLVITDNIGIGSIFDATAGTGTGIYTDPAGRGITVDLSPGTFTGFTSLGFTSDDTVTLSGEQIGGSADLQTLYGSDFSASTLIVNGSNVDLSTVTLDTWGPEDAIIINGTDGSDTLVGSSAADTINGGLGRDTITAAGEDVVNGDGANDTFVVVNGLTGSINGGAGTADEILIRGERGSTFHDLRQTDISSVEVLRFEGGSYWGLLNADQLGAGNIATVDGGPGTSHLQVFGQTIDLGSITFINWDSGSGAGDRIEYFGTALDDTHTGSVEDDNFYGSLGADTYDGGSGVDVVDYSNSLAAVAVNLVSGTGTGGDADGDTLISIESVLGSGFDDTLTGDGGDNRLFGGFGDDTLFGGNGTDELVGFGGNDIFRFSATNQSGLGAASDVIADFSKFQLDLIKLDQIDAQESTAGIDDAFVYIGQDAFTAEGQIRSFQSGTRTIIQINTSGTDTAEMRIILEDFTATDLTAADFIL